MRIKVEGRILNDLRFNEQRAADGEVIQASNAFASTSSNGVTSVYAVVMDLNTGSSRNVLMSNHDTPEAAEGIVNAWKNTNSIEVPDARPTPAPTLSHQEHQVHDQKIREHIRNNPNDLSMKSQHPAVHAEIHPEDK